MSDSPTVTADQFDAAVTYAVIVVGLDPRAAGRARYEIAIRVALTQLGLKVETKGAPDAV